MYGLDLSPRRFVEPEVGQLVLFPSYMLHGTIPVRGRRPADRRLRLPATLSRTDQVETSASEPRLGRVVTSTGQKKSGGRLLSRRQSWFDQVKTYIFTLAEIVNVRPRMIGFQ